MSFPFGPAAQAAHEAWLATADKEQGTMQDVADMLNAACDPSLGLDRLVSVREIIDLLAGKVAPWSTASADYLRNKYEK